MTKNIVVRAADLLAIIIIAITTIFLWNNKWYYAVPDPDIFQYFEDGRQYLQLKLPQTIQLPPVNSILIGLLSKLLNSYTYPELLGAHLINITSAILTLWLLFQLIKKFSPTISLCVILLLITNPLFIFSSLNVTSEVLFTMATVLTLYFYQNQRDKLAYIVAGVSFLIRYEGLLLIITIIMVDLIKRASGQKLLRLSLLAMIPVFLWVIVIYKHNNLGNIIGNAYVQEIIQQRNRIPQYTLFARIPYVLTDYLTTKTDVAMRTVVSSLLYLLIIFGLCRLFFHKNFIVIIILIFNILYLSSHVFFPYAPDRYLYPLLWSLYLIPLFGFELLLATLRKKHAAWALFLFIIYALLVCLVLISNFLKIIEYYQNATLKNTAFPQNYRSEVRLAADWLNKTTFDKTVIIITYEPWIMEYFTVNKQVSFFKPRYDTYQSCDSIHCLISSTVGLKNNRILFIQQSNSLLVDSSFPSATNFNVKIFNQFPTESKTERFILLAQLSTYDSWAKIYQYQPEIEQ